MPASLRMPSSWPASTADGAVDVSIVVPCRGCAATLPTLVAEVRAALDRALRVEFILVADGSDEDAAVIAQLRAQDPVVRGVELPARRGQHAAIAVGLSQAGGDFVVVMDGDLQHRPADVPRLLAALRDRDVDVIVARRASRFEGVVVRAGSAIFFAALSLVLGAPIHRGLSSFSALRRASVEALACSTDGPRHHLIELRRLGARWRVVDVDFPRRPAGTSSYALGERCRLALSLLTMARPGLFGPGAGLRAFIVLIAAVAGLGVLGILQIARS
jgi:polyisoprenyl-phosphate glycosyltransferase